MKDPVHMEMKFLANWYAVPGLHSGIKYNMITIWNSAVRGGGDSIVPVPLPLKSLARK